MGLQGTIDVAQTGALSAAPPTCPARQGQGLRPPNVEAARRTAAAKAPGESRRIAIGMCATPKTSAVTGRVHNTKPPKSIGGRAKITNPEKAHA